MQVIDLLWRIKHTVGIRVSKLLKFWTSRRLTAASLLGKMIGLVIASALLPAGGLVLEPASAQDEDVKDVSVPQLVLTTHTIEEMISIPPRPELTITVVESKAEEQARIARDQTRATTVVQTVAVGEIDASFEQKRALAQAAAAQYGIDWKILEAVWQVESGKRWHTAVRSSAGAQGPMQFMPGTWRAYAVDGNSDGVSNVHDARDAVYAGAKLLAANGAASNIDRALLAYNHAQWYVDKVKKIAQSIEG